MKVGIIASLIGTGILAYDHYYICTISETQYVLVYALIILGIFFYFFLERE
jgi:tellurite resistance protein TehA-like permease